MNRLNLTNQQRLEKYPDGKCPLCGARNWNSFYDPELYQSIVECQECHEEFPIAEDE